MQSAFTDIYTPITFSHHLPLFTDRPVSVTDWLLLIYVVGLIASLLWYLFSYLRLRFLLLKADPASPALEASVQAVCQKYHLRSCRIVTLSGLSSAFICGVFRPVMVIPADTEPDQKILLHELLHLQQHDSLQNIFWCILRALHWCNPFLQYVFNRIGNDMESLCDQRVLERLEGEARREYGSLLLQMANDRYARAPGTTSISNGGANISRRITAIVRFKQYPKGMSLVSVCIIVVLLVFMMTGTATVDPTQLSNPSSLSELDAAMAYARIQRCTTVAGALDTYATGLLWENGIYLVMASPLSEHAQLEAAMRENAADGWVSRHLETYDGLECVDGNSVYQILGLRKISETEYRAWLAINVYGFLDEEGFLISDEDGPVGGYVLIPVSVAYEDAWVVQEAGTRIKLKAEPWLNTDWSLELPWVRTFSAEGEYGTAEVFCATCHWTHEHTVFSHDLYYDGTRNAYPNPDAVFQEVTLIYQVSYSPVQEYEIENIHCQVTPLETVNDPVDFHHISFDSGNGDSSDGFSWFRVPDNGPKEFPLIYTGNCTWYAEDLDDICITLPEAFAMQISHGSTAVEELRLMEVSHAQ